MSIYWKKCHVCPYYSSDDRTKIYCEGNCRIMFPDGQSAREYEEEYCASDHGWERCTVAISKNRYYDRLYSSPAVK